MSFDKCKICGEYVFLEDHKCKPLWEAIEVDCDDENEPQKTFGFDAESAAIRYAERNFDRWEYPEEVEIWVRKPSAEWQKFNIYVEFIPSFTAEKKDF